MGLYAMAPDSTCGAFHGDKCFPSTICQRERPCLFAPKTTWSRSGSPVRFITVLERLKKIVSIEEYLESRA